MKQKSGKNSLVSKRSEAGQAFLCIKQPMPTDVNRWLAGGEMQIGRAHV